MERENCINLNGVLEYEGELLNGEINGKGKEYDVDGNLLFEGEYLYGERWNGKGREYDFDGILLFKGEYLEGKKWNGKVYEYDDIGDLVGEYLKGKYMKKGKKYK